MSGRPRRIYNLAGGRLDGTDLKLGGSEMCTATGVMQRPVSVPATSDQQCKGTSSDRVFSNSAHSKRSEQILSGKQGNHWTDGRRKRSNPRLRSLPTSYYDGSAAENDDDAYGRVVGFGCDAGISRHRLRTPICLASGLGLGLLSSTIAWRAVAVRFGRSGPPVTMCAGSEAICCYFQSIPLNASMALHTAACLEVHTSDTTTRAYTDSSAICVAC